MGNQVIQPKVQKARVGVDGSFINQMMSNNSTLPEVGKGATQMHYTDRSCYEVIEVSKDGKSVKLEILDVEHDKTKEGGMGHQNWVLKPTGRFMEIVWRQGAWRKIVEQVVYVDGYYENVVSKLKYGSPEYKAHLDLVVDHENHYNLKLVEGITRIKRLYDKINIIFGRKDYYYDWSF